MRRDRGYTLRLLLGAIMCGLVVVAACKGRGASKERSVVLISVDGLRADSPGCYGGQGPPTPAIDALASLSCLFENAVAVAPVTLPAHASMLTGRHPVSHEVLDDASGVLAAEETTLAEILRERGHGTAAFLGGGPMAARSGLFQGFERCDEAAIVSDAPGVLGALAAPERSASEVNAAALPWLERTARAGEPFFLFVHYNDPRFPYKPPERLAGRFGGRPYAGEVAAVDEAVAALLEALKRSGAAERTAVILTADHGEGLGDHGENTHGYFVYQTTIRVPLIIHAPWLATPPRRVTQLVSQVDVMPTILGLMGVPVPRSVQGRSLLPLVEGKDLPEQPVMASCEVPWLELRVSPLRAILDGRLKYIESPRPELYDLSTDPGETKDVAAGNGQDAERLKGALRLMWARAKAERIKKSVESGPSQEERERLASLGYVGGSAPQDAGEVPDPSPELRDPRDSLELAHRFESAILGAGDPSKAAGILGDLVKAVPDSPFLRERHGQSLLLSGDAAGARAVFEQLLKEDAHDAAAHIGLGQSLEVLGLKQEALKEYEAASLVSDRLPEARFLLGRLLFRAGKPDEGVEEMRKAIQTAPASLMYRRGLAAMLDQVGRGKEVEELMLDYTRAAPDDPRSWNELASVRLRRQNWDGAEKALREALRVDPANAVAHANIGGILLMRGQFKQAEEQYRAALKVAPDMPEANVSLGRAVLFQRREEEGRKILDEWAARSPGDSRVHSYWGLYLLDVRKDTAGAREAFARALQLDPRDPVATSGLAEAK